MPKRKSKKGFIRPVHLQALAIIIIYLVISRIVFVKFVTNPSLSVSFLGLFIYGVAGSFIFLYLFSHEDFFHFIKGVEKQEKKKENQYLKKYKRFGKIAAVIIVAVLGGTILAALTARLLLMNYKYKYIILLISMFFSTIFSVGIAKGILSFI
jgi:hypothetical protein